MRGYMQVWDTTHAQVEAIADSLHARGLADHDGDAVFLTRAGRDQFLKDNPEN
jgi:hypothetical protein